MAAISADEAYEIIQDRKRLIEYTKQCTKQKFGSIAKLKHDKNEKMSEFVHELPYDKIAEYIQNLGEYS